MLALVHGRNPLGHPDGQRVVQQVVIKKLLHATGKVLAIVVAHHPVRVAIVIQHPAWFLQSPQGHEQFDALVPGDGGILVVVQDQQGCVDPVRKKQGRVGNVLVPRIPQRVADPALRLFVLEHPAHSGAPANAAIGTGHVADRCPGFGTGKQIGLGNQPCGLVPAPTVPLHPDPGFIDKPLIHHELHPGQDSVGGAGPRFTGLVGDIRNKQHVAPADIETEIDDRAAGGGRMIGMQVVTVPLVEINQQRILVIGIKIIRLVQQAVQRLSVTGRPVDQLGRAPAIFVLVRVDVTDSSHRPESGRRCPQIGTASKGASRENRGIAVAGLLQAADPFIDDKQGNRCGRRVSRGGRVQPVIAGSPGSLHQSGQHQRLIGVDVTLQRIQLDIAKADFLAAPAAGGQTDRGILSLRVDLPDIPPVVYQQTPVRGQPASRAIGAGQGGCVVQLVVQRMSDAPSQIDDRGQFVSRRFSGRHAEP